MAKKNLTVEEIIEILFEDLDSRQKKVLIKRFGLENGKEVTLAQLGNLFNVTRERIRQIEAGALEIVKNKAKSGHIDELIAEAVRHIDSAGGVKKENHLLTDLSHYCEEESDKSISFASRIRFLLDISGDIYYHREDELVASHWHLSEVHQKKAFDFLSSLVKHLKDKKKQTINDKMFNAFFTEVSELHKLEKDVANHYLKISKKFGENIYGDFGLMSWAEVNPRVSKDWIYLILKKANRPMHFKEIADEIKRIRPTNRKTNTQTIHNELIKDKRFILVGRGIYGLREMDELPAGTIREVLIHILKNQGPMKPKDIITAVLKNRIFKETTILFNLQNKQFFSRLKDGSYSLNK
ncbi:MAG: hypothetical protein COU06_00855 [Candidatus Harrisonbacteria bacterium CG10_big_fil_rev_8_21_14_0_10_38_8]|uniref:HTH HARE-type domain-containing protein n=1 Tax=Candidatus Harrisonbacteria bacterium CG10_big_fil_rev_8_21_14_0_10_38_8 TaxID=1974582 RepID=A0A2M6WKI2_9BACT|nr:MAG: hypothetical protein COU06_00855 [Candidatus Harrisonbacteria bacterium CG10_big_fil_rev_8_21_14_0_10_38_8]